MITNCPRCKTKLIKLDGSYYCLNCGAIGEAHTPNEIKINKHGDKFIWTECPRCGKFHWVMLRRGKPRSVMCKRCLARMIGLWGHEIAHLGGEATSKSHEHEFYVGIGRKGAEIRYGQS